MRKFLMIAVACVSLGYMNSDVHAQYTYGVQHAAPVQYAAPAYSVPQYAQASYDSSAIPIVAQPTPGSQPIGEFTRTVTTYDQNGNPQTRTVRVRRYVHQVSVQQPACCCSGTVTAPIAPPIAAPIAAPAAPPQL